MMDYYAAVHEVLKSGADVWRGVLAWQAHFKPFTARDEQLSRSLNSDYLGQVMIAADTSRLDPALAQPFLADPGLSDEAQTILVRKRGWGTPRLRVFRASHEAGCVLSWIPQGGRGCLGNIWKQLLRNVSVTEAHQGFLLLLPCGGRAFVSELSICAVCEEVSFAPRLSHFVFI